ncbi:MAG: hemerythrin domain-containing protein [Pararhodobacter sp.]|nr:hemerythrin domain-containing protein [Pararhodobacter sp.]
MDDLEGRSGLPDALRVLLRDYPRESWESHAHFDGLTRFWLERHLMFRSLHSRLLMASRDLLDRRSDPVAFAPRAARLGGFLIEQLHGHHQIEDLHYFPVLAGAEPRLERGFALLDADHNALDGHLHELTQGLNATLRALHAGTHGAGEAGELEKQLALFGRFLDRHLTDEEELVVPVILHHALRM